MSKNWDALGSSCPPQVIAAPEGDEGQGLSTAWLANESVGGSRGTARRHET